MSFLAPLFVVAGVLAVSLPVLFHLLRRTPRGKLPFSSLMFLSPSPPRLTRRSRLENWPLLLLRALAILLLALAFGRPFLRQLVEAAVDSRDGEQIVLLLDTSASLRRGDLWQQARQKLDEIVANAGPRDRMAIFAFDRQVRPLVTFEQWNAAEPAARPALVREHLAEVQPTWLSTNLDSALVTAADLVEEADGRQAQTSVGSPRKIILISDLQAGARLERLQAFEWPAHVKLQLALVATPLVTNAGLQWVTEGDVAERPAGDDRPRVRVTNSADARRESFQLGWEQPGAPADAPVTTADVYVPPGQSRVIRAPKPPYSNAPQTLVLSGDDHPFDNRVWRVPAQPVRATVLYLGEGKSTEPDRPQFFLAQALAIDAGGPPAAGSVAPTARSVTLIEVDPAAADGLKPADLPAWREARLAVVAGPLGDWKPAVAEILNQGGAALFLLLTPEDARGLADLLGAEVTAEEAPSDKYAMLGEIDFRHPLFAPFRDPKFSDFTKIRFWKHRKLDVAKLPAARVLARFDDESPALVEFSWKPTGEQPAGPAGVVWGMSAGWQPGDSQLALSTKFVPLVTGMMERGLRTPPRMPQYEVGEGVRVVAGRVEAPEAKSEEPNPKSEEPGPKVQDPSSKNQDPKIEAAKPEEAKAKVETVPASPPLATTTIRTPSGRDVSLAGDAEFIPEEPGIYEASSPGGRQTFAVNLSAAESRTAPLTAEVLEGVGVKLASSTAGQDTPYAAELKRQLQSRELEQQQKLWRWLLAAALGVLILETLYAGWCAKRSNEPLGTG